MQFWHLWVSISITTPLLLLFLFFFNDTATTEIYTLSLHDALPILLRYRLWDLDRLVSRTVSYALVTALLVLPYLLDRKSTRLNSSHANISYAVFCLKKKKKAAFSFAVISSPYGTADLPCPCSGVRN